MTKFLGQNSASLSSSTFHHGMGKGSREITLLNGKKIRLFLDMKILVPYHSKATYCQAW